MAKECSPLWRTAATTFLGTVDLCKSDRTLPVPLSGSNDCAIVGVAKVVSTAMVVRSFFMSLLLWLEFSRGLTHRRRLQNVRDIPYGRWPPHFARRLCEVSLRSLSKNK